MVVGGIAMSIIALCLAEVASQFSEPGGPYLYARTALGRFAGMQVGWFSLLSPIGGSAANTSLFMIYLSGFLLWAGHGWPRALLLAILVSIPTAVNYVGVRSGARLNNLLTAAKLVPLGLLIVLGLVRFGRHFEVIHQAEITGPGSGAWLTALLLLTFAYGGFENSLIPTGEIKEPVIQFLSLC
jgi:basic amino acid/polyamine antiporter, APA family